MLSPAQCLAIYGGATLLAYIESSGFEKDRQLLLGLPMLILAALTLATTMHPKVRFTTAMAFLLSAVAAYFQSSNRTTGVLSSIILTVSNAVYYLSYRELVTSISSPIFLLATVVSCGAFFHVLQDLIVAIPFLVLVLAVLLISHILLISTAASLCHSGHHGDFDARQASLIRLIGTIVSWIGTFLLIFNSFHTHTNTLHSISRLMFYIGHSMLFFANERAF